MRYMVTPGILMSMRPSLHLLCCKVVPLILGIIMYSSMSVDQEFSQPLQGADAGSSTDREGKCISALHIYSDRDELLLSPNWKGSDVTDLQIAVWLIYLSNGAILETNTVHFYYWKFGIFSRRKENKSIDYNIQVWSLVKNFLNVM